MNNYINNLVKLILKKSSIIKSKVKLVLLLAILKYPKTSNVIVWLLIINISRSILGLSVVYAEDQESNSETESDDSSSSSSNDSNPDYLLEAFNKGIVYMDKSLDILVTPHKYAAYYVERALVKVLPDGNVTCEGAAYQTREAKEVSFESESSGSESETSSDVNNNPNPQVQTTPVSLVYTDDQRIDYLNNICNEIVDIIQKVPPNEQVHQEFVKNTTFIILKRDPDLQNWVGNVEETKRRIHLVHSIAHSQLMPPLGKEALLHMGVSISIFHAAATVDNLTPEQMMSHNTHYYSIYNRMNIP